MPLNTAAATATLRDLTVKFDSRVRASTPVYPQICTVVDSKHKDEKYGWLGSMPAVREYLGDRQFKSLRAATYVLANKKWENSVPIEKDDLEDDTMGLYGQMVEQVAEEAAYHPDKLLLNALQSGDSNACSDGQNFFDTDHEWGASSSQSNKITSQCVDPASPTALEFRKAYHAALTAMCGFKRDNGEPFMRPVVDNLDGLSCWVPLTLREAATAATKSQIISNSTNIVLNDARVVASPYFTSGVKFWVLFSGGVLRPFVFQARKPLQRGMKGLDDLETKFVKFMTEARYNVGYLAWFFGVQVTLIA